MELKDFVAESLVQIAEGVIDAQGRLNSKGAKVNPSINKLLPKGQMNYAPFAWADGEGANPLFLVSFDVAVTTTHGTKTKGGVGVVTGVVSLGSSGATDKAASSASRIAFQVPLLLPSHPKSRGES